MTWSDGCACTFDDGCDGDGTVYCHGCCRLPCCADTQLGCSCECCGERPCPGCDACRPERRDHRDDELGWEEHWRDIGGEG